MRDNHKDVSFFTGVEVENSPALGFDTLFVVGLQSVDKIEQKIEWCNNFKIEHLYFGANQSFVIPEIHSSEFWAEWTNMIKHFLDAGYWATLDLNIKYVKDLHETGLCEFNTFIPMISAPIPYIGLLNYNATLKIDDIGLGYSNPGVWCHQVHDLQNRSVFTDWSKYSDDKVVSDKG